MMQGSRGQTFEYVREGAVFIGAAVYLIMFLHTQHLIWGSNWDANFVQNMFSLIGDFSKAKLQACSQYIHHGMT